MKRQLISADPARFPAVFRPLLTGVQIYDSSCSPAAKVFFLDRDGGYYLKQAPAGTLKKEAALTRFFHDKGLAAEVLAYESLEQDWLLTARLPGEDCTHPAVLSDPRRLCDMMGEQLRALHAIPVSGCPVHRTADYLAAARHNHSTGHFDMTLFPDNWGYASPEAAWEIVERCGGLLQADTLIHGDYCLPNILLDNWRFSGFVDLDSGGIGDRHVDLFWGAWTLQFNLKTDRYRDRFLDAYGRDTINEDLFPVIAAIEVFG